MNADDQPETVRSCGATRRRFDRSERLLERALKTIPLGTQTFSKSHIQYPHGVSPYFIARAEGSRAWDIDGNEYIDFVSSLAAVTLGHNDPDVSAAVKSQIDDGTVFSLAHPLEIEVAETIVDMVPCAEMVRFGKNGSDATAGAVRAARAYTGRDQVAVCGYHGWQDWYIGSTARHKGVPAATRALTDLFTYNDLDSLERLFEAKPKGYAAVVIEPMNTTEPTAGFLEGVKDLTKKHGALLIFDEIVTGFRLAEGGAQERFGVTPDLSALGKGLANGYPLSAVVGSADVMREFEEIFFSFTMGGEAVSLAAGLATLRKIRRERVCDVLHSRGARLVGGVRERIERHGCAEFLSITGDPSWSFLIFRDFADVSQWAIKTLWMQEALARGVLSVGTHNMTYAHTDADVDRLLAVYDDVFPLLRIAAYERRVEQLLRCKPLEPLFRVR